MVVILLPEELVHEILSWLSVKDLTRLRCVCKSWNLLILSNSAFIKLHLLRSASRNPRLLLLFDLYSPRGRRHTVVHFPITPLIQNPSMPLPDDDPRLWFNDSLHRYFNVVGSCNGLVCLEGYSMKNNSVKNKLRYDWLQFWNPATGVITGRLGSRSSTNKNVRFTFGYDDSNDAFKVVFFDLGCGHERRKWDEVFPVSVFTLGCNLWKDIENCPLVVCITYQKPNNGGVNLRGTLNWLACDKKYYAPDWPRQIDKQYVILSLDLATEAYTQFSLPPDLGGTNRIFVGDAMDCLCISYICKKTHFVMWQMKEFGVENSWTQLFKISYQDLHVNPQNELWFPLLFPLYLYNGDTLLLATGKYDQAIIYNTRENRAARTSLKDVYWWLCMGHVESLVSPFGRSVFNDNTA